MSAFGRSGRKAGVRLPAPVRSSLACRVLRQGFARTKQEPEWISPSPFRDKIQADALSGDQATGKYGLSGSDKVNLPMFDEFNFSDDADLEYAALTLETFVYCSRAAESVDHAEVSRIIEFSQSRNVARGITGVLVFGSGVFFQWVEGPPAEVTALIANLHNDTRHYDIVTLDRNVEKRERLYPHWDMEHVEADDIRAVLQDALESAEDENNVAALQRILAHFDAGPLPSVGRS